MYFGRWNYSFQLENRPAGAIWANEIIMLGKKVIQQVPFRRTCEHRRNTANPYHESHPLWQNRWRGPCTYDRHLYPHPSTTAGVTVDGCGYRFNEKKNVCAQTRFSAWWAQTCAISLCLCDFKGSFSSLSLWRRCLPISYIWSFCFHCKSLIARMRATLDSHLTFPWSVWNP